MWPPFAFKTAFVLGTLAHSFSDSFPGRFLQVSWRHCHSSSGFSLSLFCFFMSFQKDWMMIRSDLCVEHWLMSDFLCIQKYHWIITINGKRNVWKCKPIFPPDTLLQNIEITGLKPCCCCCCFVFYWKYNGLILLHSSVCSECSAGRLI